MPLDVRVWTTDRFQALREACIDACYAGAFHAAVASGLEFSRWRREVYVKRIPDTALALPTPNIDAAYDHGMSLLERDSSDCPPGMIKALSHWLVKERMKRRNGEQEDELDISWLPDLLEANHGYIRQI